jgi:hypothetical protein
VAVAVLACTEPTASSMGKFLRNQGCCLICVSVMRSAGLATKMRASRSWHSGLIFSAGGIEYLTARMRCSAHRQEQRGQHTRPDSTTEGGPPQATCRLWDVQNRTWEDAAHDATAVLFWQGPSAHSNEVEACGRQAVYVSAYTLIVLLKLRGSVWSSKG